MLTSSIKRDDIKRDWYVVDADNKILGRLASEIAQVIRGKRKPFYTPNLDMGDFVVVINAEKVAVSGKKEEQKKYFKHSGYPGGDKEISLTMSIGATIYQPGELPDTAISRADQALYVAKRNGRNQVPMTSSR